MQVLFVRHGIAEDPELAAREGRTERLRELTTEGIGKMKKGALGLRRVLESIDIIATSPLVRALQTAEIVAGQYPNAKLVTLDLLAPGVNPDKLLSWLEEQSTSAIIALVGHEPDFSFLIGWMLADEQGNFIEVKKGSAILLELHDTGGPGCAVLKWALAPKQLRSLE